MNFAALGVGIDDDAVDIMGEFDAAALEIGETIVNVAAVEVSPAGWARR